MMTPQTSITLSRGREARTMKLLPIDYVLGDKDVLCCARGSRCFHHVGNQIFRMLVEANLVRYTKATTKFDKTSIICEIVHIVRRNSPDGGFVKKDLASGRYYEVGDFLAREKTSQAFRDALDGKPKKSGASSLQKARKVPCSKNRSLALGDVWQHSSDIAIGKMASNEHHHHQSFYQSPLLSSETKDKLRMMLEENCSLLNDSIYAIPVEGNISCADLAEFIIPDTAPKVVQTNYDTDFILGRQHYATGVVPTRVDCVTPPDLIFSSVLESALNCFDQNHKPNEIRNKMSNTGYLDQHHRFGQFFNFCEKDWTSKSSDACSTKSLAPYDKAQVIEKQQKDLPALSHCTINNNNAFEAAYAGDKETNHDFITEDERTFDLLLQFSESYSTRQQNVQ